MRPPPCRGRFRVCGALLYSRAMRSSLSPLVLLASLLICSAAALSGQTPSAPAKLPADIDPQSLSRLPFQKKADLDANGVRIFEELNGKDAVTPRTAPGAAVLYS